MTIIEIAGHFVKIGMHSGISRQCSSIIDLKSKKQIKRQKYPLSGTAETHLKSHLILRSVTGRKKKADPIELCFAFHVHT